jgi:hypothetical protein
MRMFTLLELWYTSMLPQSSKYLGRYFKYLHKGNPEGAEFVTFAGLSLRILSCQYLGGYSF